MRSPPFVRSTVKRPRRPFWLSRWAGGRPPKERPPAQRERPCNREAGSEWSRRCCRGATGAVAPVAIFTVCYADSENHAGQGPTTPVPTILFLAVKNARNWVAGRGSESPWWRCLQRRHGDSAQTGEIRRETARSPFLTAALPLRSEWAGKHRQPVGGDSVVLTPGLE
ncbi:hypothetical protein NDU88_001639 [Pleurodeles waltl]|uniref:Uncharacterized protein n=1 Tax=Pleurodeles waltl TaxID=8319 RepID=A0AAV7M1N1_PLEWA|nr:hypothetical protein NDU88_001639 [Pleurodeles waltl]